MEVYTQNIVPPKVTSTLLARLLLQARLWYISVIIVGLGSTETLVVKLSISQVTELTVKLSKFFCIIIFMNTAIYVLPGALIITCFKSANIVSP